MNRNILGIDIGSVSVGIVEVTPEGEIVNSSYRFHGGKIAQTIVASLQGITLSGISQVAATSSTPGFVRGSKRYDNNVCLIAGVRRVHPDAGAILNIGAERFSLLLFDEGGNYRKCRTNTSCAAGTGSFLDQQALRLNLSGSEELGEMAAANTGALPRIASRCAVFAKTDLIHAQQEGYALSEICDGICSGLAKNITDTLFGGEVVKGPIIACGGVSKNAAVMEHIQQIIGEGLVVDGISRLYGAFGAAVRLSEEGPGEEVEIRSPKDLIEEKTREKEYAYGPLELKLSDYPDFAGTERYDYTVRTRKTPGKVEVDMYREPGKDGLYRVFLGVDIGSTSTKAVLMDEQRNVVAGFYTWTSGRPVDAVCALFEAIDDFAVRTGVAMVVLGAGTTGSGRKLVGKIINADMVIDEITAHARSACELRPDVDTIIEIGGQDSKFTTIRNSFVTFSAMNTVCAAGTGSFIEEQAKRMSCPLADYPSRTEGRQSPMSSDRCTVFMERDMNYYLSRGYSSDEVLASALHSVRENYLTKVAIPTSIGDVICFQGATAKNRALVAAFEQKLGKPIHVSKYCHLTGALGVALMLADEHTSSSAFRGFGMFRSEIPVHSEVCTLCTNSCKLTVAQIGGEKLAYGFLCGRDYETKKRVSNNTSGFDLLKARAEAYSFPRRAKNKGGPTIGLPAALHLSEDIELWQHFFDALSIRTVTSGNCPDALRDGRNISGAEFCAPLTALYGHVHALLKDADYVFLPFYLEEKQKSKDTRRQYCYYTQYAPSLVAGAFEAEGERILTPLIEYLYNPFHAKVQLYRMLKRIPRLEVRFLDVSEAYDAALEFRDRARERLLERCKEELAAGDGISVVLLGRPYTVLSRGMNKGMIELFASRGIRAFSHDMLPCRDHVPSPELKALLDELPWKHAASILAAADMAAAVRGLYPVLVTSFRCSPDSFVVEYFKRLMDSKGKPYLILQLDEHDSNVGYETRIEAAIRSFQHHFQGERAPGNRAPFANIVPVEGFAGKTLLFPNWDHLSCRLLVAALKREGVDARLLEAKETSLLKSLKYNTGQCIPISIMAQEFIDTVEEHGLDPARCVLWIARGEIACNLKMIPHHIKSILNGYGRGMERAQVYHGELSMMDISLRATVNCYFAFMFGGLLRKLGCKIRPYETVPGMTDGAIGEALEILDTAFREGRSKEDALRKAVALFEAIPRTDEPRRKVAIFGDLYVRDNDFSNQNLVRFIEAHGGEVITTPYSSYMKMIAHPYFKKWLIEGKYLVSVSSRAYLAALKRVEKRYYRYFEPLLEEPDHEYPDSATEILRAYHLLPEHTGESMDNIVKTHYIKKYYPDVALFILTGPAFCCPALVTEAMEGKISEVTGVPVVNITYDGTLSSKNDVIIPFLAFPVKGAGGRCTNRSSLGGHPAKR
ncbi:MAG: acyl-CoA dehydratase activase [Syntrophaceae bacterium]